MAILGTTRTALVDIDLYWHILAGSALTYGITPRDIGVDWSFAPDPLPWTSTQWISEVILYGVHRLGSWTAIAALRILSTAIALAALAVSTLRHRPAALAGLPFVLATAGLFAAAQERPQQFTFIGAAALGGVLVSGLSSGRLPRWWVVFAATALWANLHGGWALVPLVFGLIAVGRAADHGAADRSAVRALGIAALSAAAGAISPAGFINLLMVARISSAADLIVEWQPASPVRDVGGLMAAMLILSAVGWARASQVPRSELITVLCLSLISWTAIRHVVPMLLLLSPLVAQRLTDSFPRIGRAPEPRWSTTLGIGVAAAFTLLGLALIPGRDHLPADRYPIGLAGQISQLAPDQRVLNDYNVAGLVLYFGGPGTRVGIDGRTDRYGSEYISRYAGLLSATGDWQPLLDELDPTSALLEQGSALAHILAEERSWQVVGTESGFVLMVPPGSPQ